MADIVVQQGYDLRIAGNPETSLADAPFPERVAVRPIRGMKVKALVEEGDRVLVGTPIIADKANPKLVVTSPASGTVAEVKRGARRAFIHVAIKPDAEDSFEQFGSLEVSSASREQISERLLASGCWPFLRQHPFAKVANPEDTPKAIFVSAVQKEPFLPDPSFVLSQQDDGAFQVGLDALAKLTDGKVHLTVKEDESCPALQKAANVQKHTISGPHPAGDPAVQAFYIDRVKPGQVVWYIDPQDVQAIGRLCQQGTVSPKRIITLAGNGVLDGARQYFRATLGMGVNMLIKGKLEQGEQRIVAGGLLTGENVGQEGFLGLYDRGINVVPEGRKRELFGWLTPGGTKYSWSRAFTSALSSADHKFEPDTNLNGGERACIQSGYCLKVCPTDVQPLFAWKAVSYGDLEEAEQLGIMDCTECGLCTFVCPSKIEIGSILRSGLDQIEKEG